jgi:hypothetical protein
MAIRASPVPHTLQLGGHGGPCRSGVENQQVTCRAIFGRPAQFVQAASLPLQPARALLSIRNKHPKPAGPAQVINRCERLFQKGQAPLCAAPFKPLRQRCVPPLESALAMSGEAPGKTGLDRLAVATILPASLRTFQHRPPELAPRGTRSRPGSRWPGIVVVMRANFTVVVLALASCSQGCAPTARLGTT